MPPLFWQVAPFAAVVTTFVAVSNYFSDPSWRYDKDGETIKPVEPQAEITSKVYFDVAIEQEPVGRIVIGLYGNVVPKTCHNFETICRGGTKIGNIDMTYTGSSFHRIIPGTKSSIRFF